MTAKSRWVRFVCFASVLFTLITPSLAVENTFAQAKPEAQSDVIPNLLDAKDADTQPLQALPIAFAPYINKAVPQVKFQTHSFGGTIFI